MSKSSTLAFTGFNQLSANVFYCDPLQKSGPSETTSTSASENAPSLVILATWMGAVTRPIAKYLAGYQTLYPKTPILLLRNETSDVMYRSTRTQISRLQPALEVLEIAKETPSARILLHFFSNGGSIQIRTLAQMYKAKYNAPLPVTGMILDSCPGLEDLQTNYNAFAVGLPKFWLLRALAMTIISIFFLGHYIANIVFGKEPFLRKLRRQLNDPSLFPTSAPRVYVYSKTDDMVRWQDVESHAAEAATKGWSVKTDRFEESKHVGHMVVDAQRYWANVKSVA
ncbi:hypothetical protein BT63DRAFT_421605 [Microthyrium microscopicum]|uniref:Indole-diterpene biosynthesis protein PaxU n=1 Tax=Microthyrium microscopicum TaxID=703497 RepID=A0A6A6UPY3_9PEZI|nr:hypothetical protein BT63DRAFT_421605 [Microthyrium microscopicum]